MSLERGVWKLWRTSPDFGPLDFMQRFEATFDDARDEIRGNWEASEDEGASWKHDFELIYRRAR
jgi:hypothetical protein